MTAPEFNGDVVARVDALLRLARERRASDIHLTPQQHDVAIRMRVDGLLEASQLVPADLGRSMISRLMVLAKLLTYRLDVPQEGRASVTLDGRSLDLRVSVIPTLYGIRCALRLPVEHAAPDDLTQLGLPPRVIEGLDRFSRADSGMILVCGPAGSGKTTTIYALLRHLQLTRPDLSILSLEDPIERPLHGITQIEVTAFGELTYERALRSIVRQDPQVLALGEVRDAATASIAMQAALSGHRLICTMHAASPGGALARLLEMGLEPFQVASAVTGVINQRLLRKRMNDTYTGRLPIATWTALDVDLRRVLLGRGDAATLDAVASKVAGTLADDAQRHLADGVTDAAELHRILGH